MRETTDNWLLTDLYWSYENFFLSGLVYLYTIQKDRTAFALTITIKL